MRFRIIPLETASCFLFFFFSDVSHTVYAGGPALGFECCRSLLVGCLVTEKRSGATSAPLATACHAVETAAMRLTASASVPRSVADAFHAASRCLRRNPRRPRRTRTGSFRRI